MPSVRLYPSNRTLFKIYLNRLTTWLKSIMSNVDLVVVHLQRSKLFNKSSSPSNTSIGSVIEFETNYTRPILHDLVNKEFLLYIL